MWSRDQPLFSGAGVGSISNPNSLNVFHSRLVITSNGWHPAVHLFGSCNLLLPVYRLVSVSPQGRPQGPGACSSDSKNTPRYSLIRRKTNVVAVEQLVSMSSQGRRACSSKSENMLCFFPILVQNSISAFELSAATSITLYNAELSG
jgi:hypothetical protein